MIDHTGGEAQEIRELIGQLRHEANALAVLLIEGDGQTVASAGEVEEFDPHSLAALDDDKAHGVLSHDGTQSHLKAERVGASGRLVVIWGERSSQGLVRLRVQRALPRLKELWAAGGGE